ncbi:MAG: glycosyl hydrolase 115 family protein [Lachnospiraceae bacterium]|nr:glycosyl hydrolase 115 family protein [Lachnospiraceae bacterium]
MMININSKILSEYKVSSAVKYAINAFERDLQNTCTDSSKPGMEIVLFINPKLEPECFEITFSECVKIGAADDLGFIYGIYHISKNVLGVNEFWFWNEQPFEKKEGYEITEGYHYLSKPCSVRYRGWFINDEVLLDDWKIDGDNDRPWEMAFEALMRLGGNMTIPGTDENAHIYCKMASEMGLRVTHHHAEPLGARMFARAYPDLDASYERYAKLYEGLWQEGIESQKDFKVIWNLGFRGQGDRPFWSDTTGYDTDEKRGMLISSLIRKQYDMVKAYDKDAICCTNLYGEIMELYIKGLLTIPEDVIYIWADNGYGKMVSRRRGKHNPRVPALPKEKGKGKHGIYYHASFYDLQAAAQMTMLPNSSEFVVKELNEAFQKGADEFWIINCSNIKPHTYILDLIAQMWNRHRDMDEGETREFAEEHRIEYCKRYYGGGFAQSIAELYKLWPLYAPKYGPNDDDHAGEQFANHGARVLATGLITDYKKSESSSVKAADEWRWFSDVTRLAEQTAEFRDIVKQAKNGYGKYLDRCIEITLKLPDQQRVILENTLIWQVKYLYYSYLGAVSICNSIKACLEDNPDYLKAFYEAGLAAKAFLTGYDEMRKTEKGPFTGFFNNDCEADIRQSYYVAKGLMSYLRFCGDGPHFYHWQRLFQQGAGGEKVHLILRMKKHLTDDELWSLMEDKKGT